MKVCDLHCDMLLFLARDKGRTPYQKEVRCAYPQLRAGGVVYQTLALFAVTKKGSTEACARQIEAFKALPSDFIRTKTQVADFQEDKVSVSLALENASLLCEEDEPLEKAFARFNQYETECGPFAYVSLTWNGENRFGGGNDTQVGLKKDGEALLEFLHGRKCPIDFSHTSDALGYGILNHIDKKGLDIRPMASHSNFRDITDHPRNLPSPLASEIFRRKGIIGLNFIRKFIGGDFETNFTQMVEKGIALGGEKQLCFGADFFCEEDVGQELGSLRPFFYEGYPDASCYPKTLNFLKKHHSEEFLQNLSHQNYFRFRKSLCG